MIDSDLRALLQAVVKQSLNDGIERQRQPIIDTGHSDQPRQNFRCFLGVSNGKLHRPDNILYEQNVSHGVKQYAPGRDRQPVTDGI